VQPTSVRASTPMSPLSPLPLEPTMCQY
jgi:hypothetical protein